MLAAAVALMGIVGSSFMDITGHLCCFEDEDDAVDIMTVVLFVFIMLVEILEWLLAMWLIILLVVLFLTTVPSLLTLKFSFLLRLTEGPIIKPEEYLASVCSMLRKADASVSDSYWAGDSVGECTWMHLV